MVAGELVLERAGPSRMCSADHDGKCTLESEGAPRPEFLATVPGPLTKPVAATACYKRLHSSQAD